MQIMSSIDIHQEYLNYFLIFHDIFILIFIFILFLETMTIILICLKHVKFSSGLFSIIAVSQLVTSILIIIFIRFLLISWHLERILLFSITFYHHHHPHFHYIYIRLIFYSLQFFLHHHYLSHYYFLLSFSQVILGPVIMFLHPSTTQQVRVWFFHLKSVRCRKRICKVG